MKEKHMGAHPHHKIDYTKHVTEVRKHEGGTEKHLEVHHSTHSEHMDGHKEFLHHREPMEK